MPSAGLENAPLREQRGAKDKADVDGLREQHSTRERPFIHIFRSGVFKADLPASMKLVLLVLAEFANAGGGSCYPSITSIAKLAHLNERTVRRLLEQDSPWQARIGQEGKGRHWRTYEYQLRIPEGADTTPARWESGADTMPARWESRCGHSQPEARTLSAEGADTTPADVGLEIGKSRLGENQKKKPRAKEPRAAPLARPDDVSEQTWADWLALRKAKRAPVTQTVLTQATAEACKAGMALEQFLGIWCARGSQGLQADWLKPNERTPFNARASTLTNAPQRGAAGMVPSDTRTVTASDAEAALDIATKRLEATRHG